VGKAVSALRSQEEMLKRARRFIEKALDTSDIDVVIVARGVEKLDMKERPMLLADVAEPGVDYLVYSGEEWRSEKSTWIRELKKEAVKIYPWPRQ